MRIHISKIYGYIGTGAKRQETVAAIAKRDLHYDELGIYRYQVESDTPEMLGTRLDGILASVYHGDIVIIQSPTWNGLDFEETLMRHLYAYRDLGKIIFIHDVPPLMSESYRPQLQRYIDYYNQADLVIVPSRKMLDVLREHGLMVKKTVIHKMFDYVASADETIKPVFRKVVNLAGNPNSDPELEFCRDWKSDNVQLAVTADGGDWAHGKNIGFLGWFRNDNSLVNALRKSGGFGLLWSVNFSGTEYNKINAPYKLSVCLAAGLPVVVPVGIAEQDTVIRKNLGFAAATLEEAADMIEHMKEEEYRNMAENVGRFSYLLREGFFTRKALTDAVFQLLGG